jgi:hypothetical protein
LEESWQGEDFCIHSVLFVLLLSLPRLRLVSLRDVGLVSLFVQIAWLAVAYQHRALVAPVTSPAVPFGTNIGFLWIYTIHVICAITSLIAFVAGRAWVRKQPSSFSRVLLFVACALHAFPAIADTQHLFKAPFLLHNPFAVSLTQLLAGVAHFTGLFGTLLALLDLVHLVVFLVLMPFLLPPNKGIWQNRRSGCVCSSGWCFFYWVCFFPPLTLFCQGCVVGRSFAERRCLEQAHRSVCSFFQQHAADWSGANCAGCSDFHLFSLHRRAHTETKEVDNTKQNKKATIRTKERTHFPPKQNQPNKKHGRWECRRVFQTNCQFVLLH